MSSPERINQPKREDGNQSLEYPPSSSKKKKRTEKKIKGPPYKTYSVVTPSAGGSWEVQRPINPYDVLLVEGEQMQNGYDFAKQPGNLKYAMLVDLSTSNFHNMVEGRERKCKATIQNDVKIKDKEETDEKDDEAKHVLARNIVETIRDDWKGLFLRKTDPTQANCTQWIDIGFAKSVDEVYLRVQANVQNELFENKQQTITTAKEGTDRVVPNAASAGTQLQAQEQPPVNRDEPKESPINYVSHISGSILSPIGEESTAATNSELIPLLRAATTTTYPPLPPIQLETAEHPPADKQHTNQSPVDICKGQKAEPMFPAKRGRGRPRKDEIREPVIKGPKRNRGRPRKTDAEKAADALKRAREGKGKQGPKKLINTPGIRDAVSVAPLQDTPGAGLLLCSTDKKRKILKFQMEESETPEAGKFADFKVRPPVASSVQPLPAARTGITSFRSLQARNLLSLKDPNWIVNYDNLKLNRASLYSSGQPEKWVAGLVRHRVKIAGESDETEDANLHRWIVRQQQMYREYCEWEEKLFVAYQAGDSITGLQQHQERRVLGRVYDMDLPPLQPDSVRMPNLGQTDESSGDSREGMREVERAKILLLDDIRMAWKPDQEPPEDAPRDWRESFYDLREYLRTRGDTAVPDTVELGVWAQLQRMQFQRSLHIMAGVNCTGSRPPLSLAQMTALRGLGFDWDDLESSQFHVMYLKLLEFKNRVGDCLVPPPPADVRGSEGDEEGDDENEEDDILETTVDPKLFFWVQRQRLENVRFQLTLQIAEEARNESVNEYGHSLAKGLIQEEKVDDNSFLVKKNDDDDDDGAVVAHLARSPSKLSQEMPALKLGSSVSSKGNTEKKSSSAGGIPISAVRKNKLKHQLRSSDSVSTLTQAQIDLLSSTGFIWSLDISGKWIDQYRRLHAFYIKHGMPNTKECVGNAVSSLLYLLHHSHH